ncbi:hypothetical protein MMPV_009011 [Pyropia vietnamensis]
MDDLAIATIDQDLPYLAACTTAAAMRRAAALAAPGAPVPLPPPPPLLLHEALLYGVAAADGSGRAVAALVSPATRAGLLVVVTRSEGADRPDARRLWRELVSTEKAGGTPFVLPADVGWSVRYVRERDDAYAALSQGLAAIKNGSSSSGAGGGTDRRRGAVASGIAATRRGADGDGADGDDNGDGAAADGAAVSASRRTLLVCSWDPSLGDIVGLVPAARGFPLVRLPVAAGDGRFGVLRWEVAASRSALGRAAGLAGWAAAQVGLARVAGVPLGALATAATPAAGGGSAAAGDAEADTSTGDGRLLALDVAYERAATRRGLVSWASPVGAPPDTGGGDAAGDGGLATDGAADEEEDALVPLEVTTPGMYRSVCIEAEVCRLTVATILSAAHVNAAEGTFEAFDAAAEGGGAGIAGGGSMGGGGNGAGGGGGVSTKDEPLDVLASAAAPFRVLRDLVASWAAVADADASGGAAAPDDAAAIAAAELLSQLPRWLAGRTTSVVHDGGLSRLVRWLHRKLFWQLIGELRSLGASIIYASPVRILLATPRVDAVPALRHAAAIEAAVRSRPLFRHVRFAPLTAISAAVLFLDRYNYGVLPAEQEGAILRGELRPGDRSSRHRDGDAGGDGVAADPACRMVWDLTRYMPVDVGVVWTQVVTEWIRRPVLDRRARTAAAGGGNDDPASSRRPGSRAYDAEEVALLARLTPQLYAKVSEILSLVGTLRLPPIPCAWGDDDVTGGGSGGSCVDGGTDGGEADGGGSVVTTSRRPAVEFVVSLCHVLSVGRNAESARGGGGSGGASTATATAADASGGWCGGHDPLAVGSTAHNGAVVAAGSVADAVANLRRGLLRLLRVREFAPASTYVSPALDCTLRDVVCGYCGWVADVDLARDGRLWRDGNGGGGGGRPGGYPGATTATGTVAFGVDADEGADGGWACDHCGEPLDRDAVEARLLDAASRAVAAWQLADSRCCRCGLVRRDNLPEHCPCSGGAYVRVGGGRQAWARRLRAMAAVATTHRLPLLAETLGWIRANCGGGEGAEGGWTGR